MPGFITHQNSELLSLWYFVTPVATEYEYSHLQYAGHCADHWEYVAGMVPALMELTVWFER